MTTREMSTTVAWPKLRVDEWTATRDTLNMWTQIVGKIRLNHTPLVNHWWNVTLYVTARGLTTSGIAYQDRVFDLEFDFRDDKLLVRTSEGDSRHVVLEPKPVADFYTETLDVLADLGIHVVIHGHPNEVEYAIPFAEDHEHRSYDADAVRLFWRQLIQANRVLNEFRSRFIGKVSPVQYFWGSPDLACTRFSGRTAPKHPGGAPNCGDWVMEEGYSHELSSCGFWAGGADEGAFYAYAYPEPDGFADHPVAPQDAFYSTEHRQFLLPYEAVRTAPDPDHYLLEFLQSTYEAAADNARWERTALEVDPSRWNHKRARPTPEGRT